MRPIKFRIWTDGKMEYQEDMKHFVLPGKEKPYNWDNIEGIMQFTGLFDKNGKELWEGDIISSIDGIFKIEYSEDGFYAVNGDEYSSLSSYTGQMNYEYDIDDVIVLGNIYENPNLIINI